MDIEKAIEILKEFKKTGFHTLMIKYNENRIHTNKMIENAIETLLTAYEKEKGENVKLRLQDIPLKEGELKAYKDRVNELKQEDEKEKEENKRLRKCHLLYEEMTGIDLLLPEKEE